ncbi:dihydrolipoyllysine-residue acetyltransferase component of pyruvate dehydrogenase complex [Abditibacteriota bacterium]|nr:dihydrolipoyllysine-residue acetyltransferase component of pyruvate dehydrogenase complex [Abditibacteriota bacterium]
MAEFLLPTLGETATSGVVAKVLVNPGDTVAQDQPILELETDKAVLEVPSTVAGTIQNILVKQGDTIAVNQPVFTYGDGGGASNGSSAPAAPATSNGSASQNGSIERDSRAPEQTAASEANLPSPTDGTSAPQSPPTKDDGILNAGAPVSNTAPAPAPVNPNLAKDPPPAAPSIRRMAREAGVDIYAVTGTGLGGRITEDDIKSFGKPASAPATAPVGGVTLLPLPDFSKFGVVERVPMSGIGKATAAQMDRAWTIPHVTQFDKADTTEFEKFRKKYGPLAEKAGGKLTPTAILLKIVVGALKKFPNFNSSIDFATSEIVRKSYYNIGVAVDTPRGLVVPVIKNVESKSIIQLAVELGEIAATARDGKLKPEQMTGATFTLTNLGGIGGTAFTPIVNTPEVAILGIARGSMEPVWNAESQAFEPRMMMPLCLSYDHRVINGADGARFTRFIAAALEDPNLIALQG